MFVINTNLLLFPDTVNVQVSGVYASNWVCRIVNKSNISQKLFKFAYGKIIGYSVTPILTTILLYAKLTLGKAL